MEIAPGTDGALRGSRMRGVWRRASERRAERSEEIAGLGRDRDKQGLKPRSLRMIPLGELIVLTCGKQIARRAEDQRIDGIVGCGKRGDELAGRRLPHQDLGVLSRRDERLAVGGKGKASDRRLVAGKGSDLLAGGRVPENDAGILARAGEPLAVRAKGDCVDLARVADQGLEGFPARGIPEDDPHVRAGAGQSFAIGGKCDAIHEVFVSV